MTLGQMTVDQLKSLYVRCNALYHSGDAANIILTDDEYDELKRVLQAATNGDWEPLHTAGWRISPNSPLEKVQHRGFMGSIYNAYDYAPGAAETTRWQEGFEHWKNTLVGDHSAYGMLKADGISVAIEYDRGMMFSALTRGDCVTGENVIHHMTMMRDVPAMITDRSHMIIRGEVVFFKTDWDRYKVLHPEAKNARNMAAGIMGRSDTSDAGFLRFIPHSLEYVTPNKEQPYTFEKVMDHLHALGFIPIEGRLQLTTSEAIKFYNSIAARREKGDLPYEIDGVVYAVNSLEVFRKMGIDRDRCPKGAVAWKFPVMAGKSKILSVEVTVGHNGKLTPVANLEPVEIGGVTVSRASLANFEECKRLRVCLNSSVTVARQGDVIPKITKVTSEPTEGDEIVAPETCPACGGAVGRRKKVKGDDGADVFCLNTEECPAQTLGKLNKWIKQTEIMDVGKKIIQAMIDEGIVSTPADLYRLNVNELAAMSFQSRQFGMKMAMKVVDNVNKKRQLSLSIFLGALGVNGLGTGVVDNVRAKMPGRFDKITDWIGCTKIIDFADQVGLPNTARGIQKGLAGRQALVQDLLNTGVTIVEASPAAASSGGAGPMTGIVICLTGDFPQKKQVYKEQIVALGGSTEDEVRSNVTHVVIQELPADPSKLTGKGKKAHAKGMLYTLPWLLEKLQAPANVAAGAAAPQVAEKSSDDEGYPV